MGEFLRKKYERSFPFQNFKSLLLTHTYGDIFTCKRKKNASNFLFIDLKIKLRFFAH